MALWVCRSCTSAYAPEAPACPECGSTDYDDQGVLEMAKISAAGGATYTEAELESNPELVQTSPQEGDAPTAPTDDTATDEYDPGEYYANEVNAYLDQCVAEDNRAEYDRVIDAERAGKNRTSIVNR